jgi:hypothetical protein
VTGPADADTGAAAPTGRTERNVRQGQLRTYNDEAEAQQRPWTTVRPRRRGNAVEVWLVQVGLDELIRYVLEAEPLVEEHE